MSKDPFSLEGRIALITGASKGIGRAIAQGFAQAGADLMICARNQGPLAEAAEAIHSSTGRRVEYIAADMSRREDVSRLAETALQRMGRVDILVNNAGWNIPQPIDQIRDEDWNYLIELNLNSAMALTRALVPGKHARTQLLLGHQSRTDRADPGQRSGPGTVRHHGQQHRARADRHRAAQVAPQPPAVGRPGFAHRPGPLGQARGTGRSGPAVGQRSGQFHYRHRAGGRWRSLGPGVLKQATIQLSEVILVRAVEGVGWWRGSRPGVCVSFAGELSRAQDVLPISAARRPYPPEGRRNTPFWPTEQPFQG